MVLLELVCKHEKPNSTDSIKEDPENGIRFSSERKDRVIFTLN
jgi:hypothetical protein